MKLREFLNTVAGNPAEEYDTMATLPVAETVSVMSFESREYSYYVGTSPELYGCRDCRELGVWFDQDE